MGDKIRQNIIVILIGIILWLLYICDSEMSRYGIYTIFSYNVHELLSAIPFVCFLYTVGWLLILFIKSVRGKKVRLNLFLLVLLLVFSIMQFRYFINQSQTVSTSCVASIKSINAQKLEIEIDTGVRTITLDCPMLLIDILKTDGTEYGITYEWSKSKPRYGKLSMIDSVE